MIEDSSLRKIRQQNELLRAKIDGNYEEVLLAQELKTKIDEMVEAGAKEQELDVNKIENLLKQNKELEKQAQQAEKIRQEFQQLGQSLATDVASGLKGLIKGTSTLGDMINSVLDKMLDAAINMAMFGNLSGTLGGRGGGGGLLGGLFGGLFGGGGGLLGGLLGKKKPTSLVPAPMNPGFQGTGIPSVLPEGSFGISSTQRGLTPEQVQARFNFMRADGGPVKGGNSYIVGERGPELFSPGRSGMITPNHALGGSTNVVVNVDASGSNVEGDEQSSRQLGELIGAAVQSEIIKQQMSGGLLS